MELETSLNSSGINGFTSRGFSYLYINITINIMHASIERYCSTIDDPSDTVLAYCATMCR